MSGLAAGHLLTLARKRPAIEGLVCGCLTARGIVARVNSALHQSWEKTSVDSLTSVEMLRGWETKWPAGQKRPVVKVIYDRAAGEVRITGRWQAKEFSKTFPVDGSLADVLKQARIYIAEQTRR